MRRPRRSVPLLPFRGRKILTRDDVKVLVRAGFWPKPEGAKDLNGEAIAAAFALQALAGIPVLALADMEYDRTLPNGVPSVEITVHVHEEIVRVSPALASLLKACKRTRPTTTSTKLFVTGDGEPMTVPAFRNLMMAGGTALGLDNSLARHARMFFADMFYRHPDFKAAEAKVFEKHLARFDGRRASVRLSSSERRLVEDRTSFSLGTKGPAGGEKPTSAEAGAVGTPLPATFAECFRAIEKPRRGLPPGHPLFVDLEHARVTKNRAGRRRQNIEIYLRHREELVRRAADRSLPHTDAAALFGLKLPAYRKTRIAALASIGECAPRRAYVGKRREALSPTAEEADRLNRIACIKWPAALQRQAFRWSILRKHGGFIFGLARAGKISTAAGARLLRCHSGNFSRMKQDFEADVFSHWLRPRPTPSESVAWRAFVRDKASERREDQPISDFIRYLRKRYDLPIAEPAAREALRGLVASDRRKGYSRMFDALGHADRKRLERIRAAQKPCGNGAKRLRIAFLRDHGPFVLELVRQRRLPTKDAAQLLGISVHHAAELLLLHIEGDFELCLAPPGRAESKARRELLLRELALRGAANGVSELCRTIRRRHRVFIPYAVASDIVRRYVEKDDAAGRGLPPSRVIRGPVMAPCTPEERRRLKSISTFDWKSATSIAVTRRAVLAADGDFIMRMIDERKLSHREAASLLRLPTVTFGNVRTDWRVGLAARHLEPPPSGHERARQTEIVIREARTGDPDERLERFIQRLGHDHGVLLPRQSIHKWRVRSAIPATQQ